MSALDPKGIDLIERALAVARAAKHEDAPFPLDEREAGIWHEARVNAFNYCLEMLNVPAPSGQAPLEGVKEYLLDEAAHYGARSGQLDGIPFQHVSHICRVMAERIRSALLPASAEPVAWRLRVGMQNLWSYTEKERDADFYIKQAGVQKFEKQPLYASPPASGAVEAGTTNKVQQKETDMPKLTSKIALELAVRIEKLNDQISAVYREASDYDGINNINVIRDIVAARQEADDQASMAEGMLAALDLEDDE